jgi:MoxR-like ATPase
MDCTYNFTYQIRLLYECNTSSINSSWTKTKSNSCRTTNLIKQLLIALLADEHIILEGLAGTAKRILVKVLA